MIERWVSAGIPVSQRAIQRSRRGEPGMSHGWTKTGTPRSAQCCRKVTMPSWSRSRSPTWLPISTPACPAAIARSSSAHAASVSCSGTCANGSSRSGCGGADLEGEVVEDPGRLRGLGAGLLVGEEHRGRRDDLDVDAVGVHVGDPRLGVPAARIDAAELGRADHDHGLALGVRSQPRPRARPDLRGQVGPAPRHEMRVDVDRAHSVQPLPGWTAPQFGQVRPSSLS